MFLDLQKVEKIYVILWIQIDGCTKCTFKGKIDLLWRTKNVKTKILGNFFASFIDICNNQ